MSRLFLHNKISRRKTALNKQRSWHRHIRGELQIHFERFVILKFLCVCTGYILESRPFFLMLEPIFGIASLDTQEGLRLSKLCILNGRFKIADGGLGTPNSRPLLH